MLQSQKNTHQEMRSGRFLYDTNGEIIEVVKNSFLVDIFFLLRVLAVTPIFVMHKLMVWKKTYWKTRSKSAKFFKL